MKNILILKWEDFFQHWWSSSSSSSSFFSTSSFTPSSLISHFSFFTAFIFTFTFKVLSHPRNWPLPSGLVLKQPSSGFLFFSPLLWWAKGPLQCLCFTAGGGKPVYVSVCVCVCVYIRQMRCSVNTVRCRYLHRPSRTSRPKRPPLRGRPEQLVRLWRI